MVISTTMADALNKQIAEEMSSAYIYLAMAADCHDKNLKGAAAWLEAQAAEELGHAQRIYHYILEREGRIEFSQIEKPKKSWDSALVIFKAAYTHEQHITGCIYDLVKQARAEGDVATEAFLGWFVTEQVEEEANALAVVQKLELVSESKQGLFMIDRELGIRGSNH